MDRDDAIDWQVIAEQRFRLLAAAKAEIERLRAERDEWRQCCKAEASLRREFFDKAERLREALQQIAECTATEPWRITAKALREIAREALDGRSACAVMGKERGK